MIFVEIVYDFSFFVGNDWKLVRLCFDNILGVEW